MVERRTHFRRPRRMRYPRHYAPACSGEIVVADQILALDSPENALRTVQAAIAVAGLALLAVAVYELAGAHAARIAAWVLAFEPASIFFSTLLHKEPNMMLAEGLVAFG